MKIIEKVFFLISRSIFSKYLKQNKIDKTKITYLKWNIEEIFRLSSIWRKALTPKKNDNKNKKIIFLSFKKLISLFLIKKYKIKVNPINSVTEIPIK